MLPGSPTPMRGADFDPIALTRKQILIENGSVLAASAVLTGHELVEKAALALDMMDPLYKEDMPTGTVFHSARKLRTGGIFLKLNSAAAADWLQGEGAMRAFLLSYDGGQAIMK
ncbi:hypothetical protein C8Q80DRAFT_1273401 [Daedaleopsis nitida]|nr:hypothetical protein C8Q80DRAFT_1273401 [Daedaleopsis nitida]